MAREAWPSSVDPPGRWSCEFYTRPGIITRERHVDNQKKLEERRLFDVALQREGELANRRKLPAQKDPSEKRSKKRFSIQQEVRYRSLAEPGMIEIGVGTTVNVSSSGVCFTTEKPLPLGVRVELSINWPALLQDSCRLKLVVSGPVIRSSAGRSVVAIECSEFRTQGRTA